MIPATILACSAFFGLWNATAAYSYLLEGKRNQGIGSLLCALVCAFCCGARPCAMSIASSDQRVSSGAVAAHAAASRAADSISGNIRPQSRSPT
mgnify:CR=1 FL=1